MFTYKRIHIYLYINKYLFFSFISLHFTGDVIKSRARTQK